MTERTPAPSVAHLLHRSASAGRGIVATFRQIAKAASGDAPTIEQTPKPECKPQFDLAAQIAHLKALPPHSRKRAPLCKAIYSARHDILRRGAGE